MDKYRKYIKERANQDLIETDKGFIAFEMRFPFCVIDNLFVLEEFRKEGHATFLANQVFEKCKDAGFKEVQCQTDERANGVDISKKAILNFGFKFIKQYGPVSYYGLEVSEWEAH